MASELDISILAGDAYTSLGVGPVKWTFVPGAPNLASSVSTLRIYDGTTLTLGQTGTAGGTYPGEQTVSVPLTKAQTLTLTRTWYRYDLSAVLSGGDDITLARGSVRVDPNAPVT